MCDRGSLTPFIVAGGAGVLAYDCDFCSFSNGEKLVQNKIQQKIADIPTGWPRLYSKCEKFEVESGYFHAILDMSLALSECYGMVEDEDFPFILSVGPKNGRLSIELSTEPAFAMRMVEEFNQIVNMTCKRCGDWSFRGGAEILLPDGLCPQCTTVTAERTKFLNENKTPSK